MENIRIYSKYVAAKQSTEFALFFTHMGKSARTDFEIVDEIEATDEDAIGYLLDYTFNELLDLEAVAQLPDLISVEERDARMAIWTAERGLERREDLEESV